MCKSIEKIMPVLSLFSVIFFSIFNLSKYGANFPYALIPLFLCLISIIFCKMKFSKSGLFLLVLWFVFIISTTFSDFVSINKSLLTLLGFITLYIIITSFKFDTYMLKKCINFYLTLSFLVSLNIVFNFLVGNYYIEWFHRSSFEFLGVYKDPNYVMAFITPAAILNIFNIISVKSKKNKIIYYLLEILLVLTYLCTGSRGALLSFLLSLFLLFVFDASKPFKFKLKCMIIFVFSGLFALYLLVNILPTQSIERLLFFDDGNRFILWKAALSQLKNNFIFGTGYHSASFLSKSIAGNFSHSVYIDLLGDVGIFGSLVFLCFVFYIIKCKNKVNKCFIYSVSASFLFNFFFLNGFASLSLFMPIIIITVFSNYLLSNNYLELFC